MTQRKIKVWDLPTRLFHWLLAGLAGAAIVSGQVGGNAIFWHGRFGLAIVGLLTFRVVWGVAGSTYARFSQFVPGPGALTAYLKGQWQGLGHNPLGALSVLTLLALLLLQVGSGLFANDDIAFRGPLMDLVGRDLSDRLTGLHKGLSNLLVLLVILHVGAIAFYARVKKDNLLKPMLTGWKELPPEQAAAAPTAHAQGGGLAAVIVALALAALAVWGASGAWIAPPPPPPASAPATPSW
ncbi:MAG TPA: cytochrome b/b6 domain-containing protein [Azospira sp.]|nr:cytochrome b/b6 domain-containing protein [Azospira sp.]